nr:MAG TPA: hypothetical protein [Caudoviricetes sp.]
MALPLLGLLIVLVEYFIFLHYTSFHSLRAP